MLEIRWKRDFDNRAESVRIGGYDDNPKYYYLQYRDVVTRDEHGEVFLATSWKDAELEDD